MVDNRTTRVARAVSAGARHAPTSPASSSMPSTQHAYDHVAAIFLPIAIAVFAAVVITLGGLLITGSAAPRTQRAQ